MRDQSLIMEGGAVGEKSGEGRLQLLQRHPTQCFHFLAIKKKYNLPGNGKKCCCQEGNKKDITLFLINPKIAAISKQIRVRKCRKSYPGNGKSEKFLRDDLKPPVEVPSTSNKFR
jgi:hypothetical protein